MIDDDKINTLRRKIDDLFSKHDPTIFKSVESFIEKAIRKVKKGGKREGKKVFVKVRDYYRRNELEALDVAMEIYSFIERMNLNDSDFARLLGNAKRIIRVFSSFSVSSPRRERPGSNQTRSSTSFQRNLGKIMSEKFRRRF